VTSGRSNQRRWFDSTIGLEGLSPFFLLSASRWVRRVSNLKERVMANSIPGFFRTFETVKGCSQWNWREEVVERGGGC
jgi:hypothetical protein